MVDRHSKPVQDPSAVAIRDEARSLLSKYRRSRVATSAFQLGSTLLLFFASWLAMWWSLGYGYWLTLLLAFPTAGFAVRLFILQHDCGHGSFFPSQTANRLVGMLLGVMTLTPYLSWRREHAMHHATNGQLDHRGIGDIHTLTVAEYLARSRFRRCLYRLYRHPLVLFGIGPIFHFVIMQRLTGGLPPSWKKERRSVHLTNLALVAMFVGLAWLIGPGALALIHLPVIALSASFGVWLFYVQHQFNPTYWARDDAWNYHTAAIEGSSYLDLPWPLSWVTADIGFHHIHHLDSRIPNYALARCYRAHPQLRTAERLTLWSSLACMRLNLWDEPSQRLIRFSEAKPTA